MKNNIEDPPEYRKHQSFLYKNYNICIIIFSIISIISLIFFILFGSLSLGFKISRENWIESDCFIINQSMYNIINNDNSLGNSFGDNWIVSYYNSVADRIILGNITNDYNSMNDATANLLIYFTNTTHSCYFRKTDFNIDWKIPYSEWYSLGCTSISLFGLFLLNSIFLYCFIKFNIKEISNKV